jgi:hypothetical protein
MAFISPPVGFSLFYLQSVKPPEVKTADIHKGALPFMALQSYGLAIVAFLPETVIWLLEAFGLTNPVEYDFLPGTFGSRFAITILVTAVLTVMWAFVSRTRYRRSVAVA